MKSGGESSRAIADGPAWKAAHLQEGASGVGDRSPDMTDAEMSLPSLLDLRPRSCSRRHRTKV